ncbi:MAG: hypothetical protein ABJL99_08465 [Aliishimia sp.]
MAILDLETLDALALLSAQAYEELRLPDGSVWTRRAFVPPQVLV